MNKLKIAILIIFIVANWLRFRAEAQEPPIIPTNTVRYLEWSPDGQYIAVAYHNGRIEMINPDKQAQTITLAPAGEMLAYAVAWSPDGTQVAAGVGDFVHIWTIDGTLRHRFEGHSSTVTSVAWSHDGRYLTSIDQFTYPHNVRIWDVERAVLKFGISIPIGYRTQWSPDDSKIVVGSEYYIDIYSTIDGEYLTSADLDGAVLTVAWHPTDKALVAAATITGKVYLVDIETGQLLESQSGHSDWIFGLAWHPSGNMLASASRDGNLYFWNSALVAVSVIQTGDPLYAVAWSPDGTKIAYGGDGVNTAIHIINTLEFYHATPFPSIDPTITPTPS